MAYIKFPEDKLGECAFKNDTKIQTHSYNGLGNRLRVTPTHYTLQLFLDTDQKQQDWRAFYLGDLNHGTKPFLVRLPDFNKPLFHLVYIISNSYKTTRSDEGWNQALKVDHFFGDAYVYDENGDQVTDINGDPITVSSICETKELTYCGDKTGPTLSTDPYYSGGAQVYHPCFAPTQAVPYDHLATTYTVMYAGVFAHYRFQDNLYNYMAPPDKCIAGKYNGDPASEVSYTNNCRYTKGIYVDDNQKGLIVKNFPFVYTKSAIAFWVPGGMPGSVLKAFIEGDPSPKVDIQVNASNVVVSGDYVTTNAEGDNPSYSNVNHYLISFISDGGGHKIKIYVNGMDTTSVEGVMVATLNTANMFTFGDRTGVAGVYLDDLRFINNHVTSTIVARQFFNDSLKATEYLKDGSAVALYRFEGNALDCGARYNLSAGGLHYHSDSIFYADRFAPPTEYHSLYSENGNYSNPVGSINLDMVNGFSISFWFKAEGDMHYGISAGFFDSVNNTPTQAITTESVGSGLYRLRVIGSDVLSYIWTDNMSNLNNGKWHHVVWLNNGGSSHIWVDGKDRTLEAGASNNILSPLWFSLQADAGSKFWMDHARVFNKVLNNTDIKKLYGERTEPLTI